MRKRVLIILLCLIFTLGLIDSAAATTMVVVEGCQDEYPHYLDMKLAPEIKNGIIMVSLQDLADEMDWQVGMDAAASVVSVKRNGNLVKLQIGSQKAQVNDVAVDLPAAPYLAGESVMIPLKFLSESMGFHFQSSKIWNNLDQVYITPYNLISDEELTQVNDVNFTKSTDCYGFMYYRLKSGGKTRGGISLYDSIWDVLQVYGVPRSPERTLNYYGDWSGTLEYWGTFIPNSDMGTFYEFTFIHGLLVDLTICC